MWYREGEYYREDGPAVTKYEENGDISFEEHYENGELCHMFAGDGHQIFWYSHQKNVNLVYSIFVIYVEDDIGGDDIEFYCSCEN